MTTLSGIIRSYQAAGRRIEREQQREARESARRFKEQQKLQSIIDAEQAVKDWENYVETLLSIHKNYSEVIDWKQVQYIPKPIEPSYSNEQESEAKLKFDNFKPSFFDKLFRLTPKIIRNLERKVVESKLKDKRIFDQSYKKYQEELEDWEEQQDISKGIENRDSEYYAMALDYLNPFSELKELGIRIKMFFDKNYVDVDLYINCEDVIPNYTLSQTATGKLSKKNMPKSRFNELYQDHICSSVLRVAKEVLLNLPIKYTRINAISNSLNSRTGYLEDKIVLSIIISQERLNLINLQLVDPSDSMSIFDHNMNFKTATGFNEVQKVELKGDVK